MGTTHWLTHMAGAFMIERLTAYHRPAWLASCPGMRCKQTHVRCAFRGRTRRMALPGPHRCKLLWELASACAAAMAQLDCVARQLIKDGCSVADLLPPRQHDLVAIGHGRQRLCAAKAANHEGMKQPSTLHGCLSARCAELLLSVVTPRWQLQLDVPCCGPHRSATAQPRQAVHVVHVHRIICVWTLRALGLRVRVVHVAKGAEIYLITAGKWELPQTANPHSTPGMRMAAHVHQALRDRVAGIWRFQPNVCVSR